MGYGSQVLVVGGRWLWYVDMTDWSGVGLLGNTEGAPGIEGIGRQSIDDAGGLGPLCAAHIPTLSRGSPIPPIPQG